jgi:CRP-like cAMP-binding protein
MTPVSLKLRSGSDLTAGDIALLDGLLVNPRQLNAREDIVSDGDRPGDVRVILDGIACRYKVMPSGRRAITAFLLPGDFCDLHVCILGRMDHSIGTLTPCTVADFPQAMLDDVMQIRPRIARALWWATLVDEAILREWLVNVGQRPSDQKLAHLLCELRLRLEVVGLATSRSMKLPLTQEELGDTLGISSVHVNRVFQQLKHAGLVAMQGRETLFPNLPRLEKFGEFNPDYLHLKVESVSVPPLGAGARQPSAVLPSG